MVSSIKMKNDDAFKEDSKDFWKDVANKDIAKAMATTFRKWLSGGAIFTQNSMKKNED